MARGRYYRTVRCAVEGCTETGNFEYELRRDQTDHARRLAKTPWLCSRHTSPDEVLSVENCQRVTSLIVVERPNGRGNTFEGHRSGFIHGPGFKAWADDLPVGTGIVITASVITASAEQVQSEAANDDHIGADPNASAS